MEFLLVLIITALVVDSFFWLKYLINKHKSRYVVYVQNGLFYEKQDVICNLQSAKVFENRKDCQIVLDKYKGSHVEPKIVEVKFITILKPKDKKYDLHW